jgi:hypothetical protein
MEDQMAFKSEDGKPRLRRSVTAFIDILGYTEYIRNCFKLGTGQAELQKLRDALDVAYLDLKQRHTSTIAEKDLSLQIRTFTDNLVIAHIMPEPIGDDDGRWGESCIQTVVFYVAFLQAEMARQGYLIRGAITVGDLYLDEDIVFGPALLEAYDAESKLAIFPRVILCENAVKEFKPNWTRKIPDLLIDSDNKVFIDYLDATVMIAYPDDRPFTEFTDGHKVLVVENLKKYKDNPHIRAKYEWAAIYHNSFCDRFPNLFNENEKIPLDLLANVPREWTIAVA